jgi:glucose-1-phosphate cytidylyltransferase
MWMKNKTPAAIILCGGKGIRLRPLTNDKPKPLVEIDGYPILYHVINHLVKSGIKKFYIATGYKSIKIEEFMGKSFKEIDYTIINSGDVDILCRIKDCMKFLNDDFILCYGDTISNVNIKKLIRYHKEEPNCVTVTSYPVSIPFGLMEINEKGVVKSFKEKPILNDSINIGYFYFNNSMRDLINRKKKLISVINQLVQDKHLRAYKHKGIHITINTLAELDYAKENISKIYK